MNKVPEPSRLVYKHLSSAAYELSGMRSAAERRGWEYFMRQLVRCTVEELDGRTLPAQILTNISKMAVNKSITSIKVSAMLSGVIRAHETKTRYLMHNYKQADELFELVRTGGAYNLGPKLRERIMLAVDENALSGLSITRISSLVRNMGYRRLLVLDNAVLKELRAVALAAHVNEEVSTPDYLKIEYAFMVWADSLGLGMDLLNKAIQLAAKA